MRVPRSSISTGCSRPSGWPSLAFFPARGDATVSSVIHGFAGAGSTTRLTAKLATTPPALCAMITIRPCQSGRHSASRESPAASRAAISSRASKGNQRNMNTDAGLAARRLLAAKDRRGEILIEQLSMGSHASEAAALLGALALQQGDPKRALGFARRAKVIDARNEEALVTEAAALLALHRTDEAMTLSQAPVVSPGVRAALKGIRAAGFFELGKVEEAQLLLEQSKEELKAAGRSAP